RRPVAEEVGDDDALEAYRVCRECGDRLRRLALRPIEWFNLAAVHGWNKFLLHDDFYDQDGSASQPDADNYSAEGMQAPTLEMWANGVGGAAAPWVSAQFERARRDGVLFAWAEAAARCLPDPEGLHMTIDALKAFRGRDLQDQMAALSWFRSREVLDCIEANAP